MSATRQATGTRVAAQDLRAGQVVMLAGQLVIVKAVYGDLVRSSVAHIVVLTQRDAEIVIERSRRELLDVVEGVS